MADPSRHVRVNIAPLLKFQRAAFDALKAGRFTGAMRRAFTVCGVIFRSWAKERFTEYSRGGGDWAPLAESTKRGRRKGTGRKIEVTKGGTTSTKTIGGETYATLIDTGTLIGGLDPVLNPQRGAMEDEIPGGIRVGFGGAARHPKGESASIADIAHFHQAGAPPSLPARKIIDEPPATVQQQFADAIEDGLGKEWDASVA
jgi:hypothetical protein